jgi:hypothetical protein
MKTIYKNLLSVSLSTVMCVFLASTASAQHDSRPSGGGGSSGSSASPRPSGGGGGGAVSAPRSSGGGSFSSRLNNNYSRPQGAGVSPQRQNFGNRQGNNNFNRGTNGYPQRVGSVNGQGAAIRGNFNVQPHTGFVQPRGGANFRTSPTVGYGRGGHVNGGGYWGNHGYYHLNHGYYNTYYRPRLGFAVSVLPYGYYPFYYGDYQFFYSDGLYYQYDNSQYTVVEPPIGAEINTLPSGAQSIVINGQQYYEDNGVYYQPVTKDDGSTVYTIAGKDGQLDTGAGSVQDDQPQGPQMGDIVNQLPQDCRKISVNGQKLWVSQDGVYYQELTDGSGNKTYKVVGLPSDEPDQN